MRSSPSELESWPSLLWVSFRGTIGTFVGIVGFMAGIAAWFIPPTITVSLATYVITLVISVAVATVLIEAARISRSHAAHPLPRIRLSLLEGENSDEPRIVLILEPSPLFSHGILVSVFIVQDQYERFAAEGIVQNVQEDGLVQVRLIEFADGVSDIIDDLKISKSQTLTKLRVKPYVQQRIS